MRTYQIGSTCQRIPEKIVSVHWFRQDLRLHDNPALLDALTGCHEFYPIFIFDGKVASTANTHFLRMRFLHECLEDLDMQFKERGGRLYSFLGETLEILTQIIQEWGVTRLTYQEEPEAIWRSRDDAVTELCERLGVECVSRVGHTLWDPHEIIKRNGGSPPLTYAIFSHVTETMGPPSKPCKDPEFVNTLKVCPDFNNCFGLPSYEKLGFKVEAALPDNRINKWLGGENEAIRLVSTRLKEEKQAFTSGFVMPNQYLPDLISPPKSLSSHLKFGCLSVRRFYWGVIDTYEEVVGHSSIGVKQGVVAQLIWREYFYTMSALNLNYGQIKDNPICLPIVWKDDKDLEERVEKGQTGYPFIDAIMNQLRCEGWVHHVSRHMLASYITRGDLWLSWEVGVQIFEKYLLDYDWSICAGNWMWASSSAFERALDCPKCFDPVKYGQRMDPRGDFVRRYVPALQLMPLKYLFQPWLAPRKVQEEANCIVGKDYPERINDHKVSSRENHARMAKIRRNMSGSVTKYCAPSDEEEVRRFVWLPNTMANGAKCTGDMMCDGIAGLQCCHDQ